MLVNFQLGFEGVVVALAMTVVVAIGATTMGTGPLLLVHGNLREQVRILQAYMAVAALTSLQLAAVLTAQARLETDLRQANTDARREIGARAAPERRAEAARRDAEAARGCDRRQPSQIQLPRRHEPRDPDAVEQHYRLHRSHAG